MNANPYANSQQAADRAPGPRPGGVVPPAARESGAGAIPVASAGQAPAAYLSDAGRATAGAAADHAAPAVPLPQLAPAAGPGAVPFFPADLFEEDRAYLLRLVHEIGTCADQKFILGERTARFEGELRELLGAADVVACGSGTSALTLILAAMDIGPGDEVVVPAFGCAPLASSVISVGARPVFADVDPYRMVVDPEDAARRITPRTKALMPAHVFSVMADMRAFRALADRHGLRLIEDSAVAQGGVRDGVPAGLAGDAGAYSFVQVKSFGMPGEGGVVVTRDAALGRRVRMLRNHGQDGVHRFVHQEIGWNSRFDELMAAFQSHRLPGLAARLARRADIAERFTRAFADLRDRGVVPPPAGREGRCYYVYSVLAEQRDALRRHLAARGIDAHVYYPLPLPRQPAFAPWAHGQDGWPGAEHAASRALSLPVHHLLDDGQAARVIAAVRGFALPTDG